VYQFCKIYCVLRIKQEIEEIYSSI
jgi:hypothetical protein